MGTFLSYRTLVLIIDLPLCRFSTSSQLHTCIHNNFFCIFSADLANRQVSLTTPPQTNARGLAQNTDTATEEEFLKRIDAELQKVENFTLEKVTDLRTKISEAENAVASKEETEEQIQKRADGIAEDFLRLEKYVVSNTEYG